MCRTVHTTQRPRQRPRQRLMLLGPVPNFSVSGSVRESLVPCDSSSLRKSTSNAFQWDVQGTFTLTETDSNTYTQFILNDSRLWELVSVSLSPACHEFLRFTSGVSVGVIQSEWTVICQLFPQDFGVRRRLRAAHRSTRASRTVSASRTVWACTVSVQTASKGYFASYQVVSTIYPFFVNEQMGILCGSIT